MTSDEPKTIYGLAASGRYIAVDGVNRMSCRDMFLTREAAESHKDEFRRRCVGTGGLTDMDPDAPIEIKVVMHVLHGQ